MPIPTWTVGQILTAADVDSWFVPLNVVKPSNQSKTSNTTLAADSALTLAVPANVTYQFECVLGMEGGTTGASDFNWRFTVPASATLTYAVSYFGIGGGWNGVWVPTAATATPSSSNGAGNGRPLFMNGVFTVAGTAGNLTLQWAQNTSSGTATIVYAGSYITLWRVA